MAFKVLVAKQEGTTMTYEVTVEPTGDVIEVEEGQTILDAALRSGVYLPHACGHGLCATCKVDVLEGDIEHGDLLHLP